MYSDDEKLVFENEVVKYVFYYKGDKVIAYHTYIDYKDSQKAQAAKEEISKNKEDIINKVYTNGKYVVIEYNEKAQEDMSISEIKETYSR